MRRFVIDSALFYRALGAGVDRIVAGCIFRYFCVVRRDANRH